MHVSWLVALLSVAAAFAFALSTTLKKRMSVEVADIGTRSGGALRRFLVQTLRHPLLLVAIGADVAGVALQVTALHLGSLTLVQPLLVSGMLFALLLRHRRFWHVGRRELMWALILTGCLIGFLVASGAVSSSTSVTSAADRLPAAIAALVAVGAGAVCLVIARRSVPPVGRAALIGVCVGAIYAGTAALMKAATNVVSKHGIWALASSWQLYVLLALGGLGLFLAQVAFQAGPLTASLPAISTVDPMFSVVIGALVYDERLHRGPFSGALLFVLLSLLVLAVIQLARVEASEPRDVGVGVA